MVTHAEAKARGLRHYFTGRPCGRGHLARRYTYNGACLACQALAQERHRAQPGVREQNQRYYRQRCADEPEYFMWQSAKRRANLQGLAFDLTPQDVRAVWPADNRCPILGIPLMRNQNGRGGQGPNSPSLDRLRPADGYVRGNIAVISMLANRIKQDEYDPAVFRRVAAWLETLSKDAVGDSKRVELRGDDSK